MAIPLATTTIAILRRNPATEATRDPDGDGYPDATPAAPELTIDTGVRAVISVGNGTYAGRTVGPGDSEQVVFSLACDPCDLQYLDTVVDETTAQRYDVSWSVKVPGLFDTLGQVAAGITTRKGAKP